MEDNNYEIPVFKSSKELIWSVGLDVDVRAGINTGMGLVLVVYSLLGGLIPTAFLA